MPRKKTLKSQRQDIDNANAARSVLDADVFKSALEYVESTALRQCRNAKSPEEAWRGTLRAKAAQDLRAVLHAFVANGESAAREMSEERERIAQENDEAQRRAAYLNAAESARAQFDRANGSAATRED